MDFDKNQRNLIYVNSVYHDKKTGAPNMIGMIQAIHIANQIPAMPVFLTSRDARAIQTTAMIAYALRIQYPVIHKNPNFEVYWSESLSDMIYGNGLSDRCLVIAVSTSGWPVMNSVLKNAALRDGDIFAMQSYNWNEIFDADCSIKRASQVEYKYMQDNFIANRPLRGWEDDFKRAIYQKTMYKFIEAFKSKRPDILRHQIYSRLYDNFLHL